MDGIIPTLPGSVKRRLRRRAQRTQDAALRTRYLIVLNLADGRSPTETARALSVSRNTVYRVAKRYRSQGELGLLDRREDNGQVKVDNVYQVLLYEAVQGYPESYGWTRPTWTQEMLVETLRRETGVRVHAGTLCRALQRIGARWARPRPTVGCPWSPQARGRRLKAIQRLVRDRAAHEAIVYEDEVDIHFNPKIGLDWMVPGQQKEVLTPGQNVKHYVAGAMDAQTGRLCWVEGQRKTSDLFIALLEQLSQAYPEARVIHVVLDNFRIHGSRRSRQAVEDLGGRVVLHFLPPYCPNANRIERYWQDLHAGVTRNHRCADIDALMKCVRRFLRKRKKPQKFAYKKSRHAQPKKAAG